MENQGLYEILEKRMSSGTVTDEWFFEF